MTRLRTEKPCDQWIRTAEEYLAKAPLDEPAKSDASRLSGLSDHLDACQACRSQIGELLRVDRSLEQAFEFLERSVPRPASSQIDRILCDVAEAPESGRLLRRIRRSVNTILWLAILALSCGGLAGLAWLVYWLHITS